MYRTHTLGQLNEKNIGEKVTLSGWVHRRRDHGGLIFIDLRDRYGMTQIVSDPTHNAETHATTESMRSEFVIKAEGTVRMRPDGMENIKLVTGKIEVLIDTVEILNPAKTPPFEIEHPEEKEREVNEEIRLTYRYLDLRRERMKNNIVMRHKTIKCMRDFFDNKQFLEIETPILVKGTPEGSREYIVPSRLYPAHFYVLPQSPQQMKQLLMVAGMDRYFQIARCFRDEDQRGDRQPEFTQLDIEMSFVTEKDIMDLNEELMIKLVETLVPHKKILKKPFPRITWKEAMDRFGSDKPDMRFNMEICDVTEIVKSCSFQVFQNAIKSGGVVKALKVEGGASFSRKEIDELTELAKVYEAKGLAYITVEKEGPSGAIVKYFEKKELDELLSTTEAKNGDIIFFGADRYEIACTALGYVRLACGDKMKLRNKDTYAFCWINEFPLFEYSKETKQLTASHHPFTSPLPDDRSMLKNSPEKVRAIAYDLAMNGSEVAGGSIRIHNSALQSEIFDTLKISKQDAERRFGHLLRAFQFGAPPHGGIAWGIDRLIMLFQDEKNIREVIAFPKDQKAKDLMLGAPSELPDDQIAEMHIKIAQPQKEIL
ncbi:aspartate--tRNA ligase [Candidatus Peregrinibacteria bacterium]|nr:aspartate--tRNA ligase [Candidatus Peregrinibacteria bacterium]